MSHNNWKWDHAVIDAFKPLESIRGWKKCRGCGEFPRVWIFDNGSFATCCCNLDKFGQNEARSESIMSVHARNKGNISEYSRNNLRAAWNEYVLTGERQNKLEEGRW